GGGRRRGPASRARGGSRRPDRSILRRRAPRAPRALFPARRRRTSPGTARPQRHAITVQKKVAAHAGHAVTGAAVPAAAPAGSAERARRRTRSARDHAHLGAGTAGAGGNPPRTHPQTTKRNKKRVSPQSSSNRAPPGP